jgi:hypothetical protein
MGKKRKIGRIMVPGLVDEGSTTKTVIPSLSTTRLTWGHPLTLSFQRGLLDVF